MYFATVLLAAVVLTCVAPDVVHDVSDCQDSSPLCDRLGQLERLLIGQSRQLSQQHDLLRHVQSKLSHQEELNIELAEKWSSQGDLLRQLQSKLSREEELNSELAEKLSYQSDLLGHLQSKLSHQEELNSEHAEKFSSQDDLLRQLQSTVSYQELKLSHQSSLVQQLQEEKARDYSAELKAVKERLDSVLVNTDCDSRKDEVQTTLLLSDSEDSVVSPARNIMLRSDDQGPLEAVVSHMGQQLTEMGADIQALKNTDQTLKNTDLELKNTNVQQDQAIQDAKSSIFIHWGSSQCSNASQLVYSGILGGSNYDQPGAATNDLCLTMSPVLSDHSISSYVAYLYGGEYQTYDSAHHDKDPVCAVCRASHSTTIMIPGTNVCTPGWHQHYSGFLMANYHSNVAGSEFICVDSKMESRPGSGDDHNGKSWFFTVTQCGSLPCDPYSNNKVVTCVVCSK